MCYQRALHLRPDHAEAHNNLGRALQDQGQFAEATRCYKRALDLKPTLNIVHVNLGNVYYEQGQVSASPALVDQWREKIGRIGGFKVGINWQGNLALHLHRPHPGRDLPFGQEAVANHMATALLVPQMGPDVLQATDQRRGTGTSIPGNRD